MFKVYEDILEEFEGVKGKGRLILFGSVAKGRSRFDSDIDIAIITDEKKFITRAERIADKILFKHGKVVSLIRFSNDEFNLNKEPIIKEIRKGVVIYGGS